MNSETGVWVAVLAFVLSVLGAFTRFVQRLARLESRVETCEDRTEKIDALLTRLASQMQVVSETLGAVRLHAAESYVPLERMIAVENKIDDLGRRSGSIEATQAAQGQTLIAIKDSLNDIKRAITDR